MRSLNRLMKWKKMGELSIRHMIIGSVISRRNNEYRKTGGMNNAENAAVCYLISFNRVYSLYILLLETDACHCSF